MVSCSIPVNKEGDALIHQNWSIYSSIYFRLIVKWLMNKNKNLMRSFSHKNYSSTLFNKQFFSVNSKESLLTSFIANLFKKDLKDIEFLADEKWINFDCVHNSSTHVPTQLFLPASIHTQLSKITFHPNSSTMDVLEWIE